MNYVRTPGGNTLGSTIARPEGLSRVQFGVPPNCVTKNAKDADRAKTGRKAMRHPLSFAFVRFRPDDRPLTSGSDHPPSFAYIRFRPLTFAYNFFIYGLRLVWDSGSACSACSAGGKAAIFAGWWRAPDCVTAKTPEYAALKGLFHRDSPQYVTKKKCFRTGNFNHG